MDTTGTGISDDNIENEEVYDEALDEDEHLEWVSVSDLYDDPENVRSEYTEIEELAESIVKHGMLQNISVRRDSEGKYVIIMGHRRKRALEHAGIFRTRVIVRHKEIIPDDVLAQMLAENMSRVQLDPMDEARGLHKLKVAKDCTDRELAQYVGKPQTWVSGRLSLMDLNEDSQNKVRNKRMGIGAAIKQSRIDSGKVRPHSVGKTSGAFLSVGHALAEKASRRCESLGHSRSGPNSVGGVACGECWEIVIRSDERRKLADKAVEKHHCSTCGTDLPEEVNQNSDVPSAQEVP